MAGPYPAKGSWTYGGCPHCNGIPPVVTGNLGVKWLFEIHLQVFCCSPANARHISIGPDVIPPPIILQPNRMSNPSVIASYLRGMRVDGVRFQGGGRSPTTSNHKTIRENTPCRTVMLIPHGNCIAKTIRGDARGLACPKFVVDGRCNSPSGGGHLHRGSGLFRWVHHAGSFYMVDATGGRGRVESLSGNRTSRGFLDSPGHAIVHGSCDHGQEGLRLPSRHRRTGWRHTNPHGGVNPHGHATGDGSSRCVGHSKDVDRGTGRDELGGHTADHGTDTMIHDGRSIGKDSRKRNTLTGENFVTVGFEGGDVWRRHHGEGCRCTYGRIRMAGCGQMVCTGGGRSSVGSTGIDDATTWFQHGPCHGGVCSPRYGRRESPGVALSDA